VRVRTAAAAAAVTELAPKSVLCPQSVLRSRARTMMMTAAALRAVVGVCHKYVKVSADTRLFIGDKILVTYVRV